MTFPNSDRILEILKETTLPEEDKTILLGLVTGEYTIVPNDTESVMRGWTAYEALVSGPDDEPDREWLQQQFRPYWEAVESNPDLPAEIKGYIRVVHDPSEKGYEIPGTKSPGSDWPGFGRTPIGYEQPKEHLVRSDDQDWVRHDSRWLPLDLSQKNTDWDGPRVWRPKAIEPLKQVKAEFSVADGEVQFTFYTSSSQKGPRSKFEGSYKYKRGGESVESEPIKHPFVVKASNQLTVWVPESSYQKAKWWTLEVSANWDSDFEVTGPHFRIRYE